ncbi:MAG: UDP-N-acetylglucosamine 2-epimerase (non-hydrolyzing) [Verrucomicrobiales bacterium]
MKILTVVGNRPQFIKAVPVSRALQQHGIDEDLLHTGQHYDPLMSEVFFTELELPRPAYCLKTGSGPHGRQTGEMLAAIEEVLQRAEHDAVIVYGDTNSTLAGALAASKLRIPVAHVEAGLRSRNRDMPEEINRIVTDHVSEWFFCPTSLAVRNLRHEGITRNVNRVGDVMLDASLLFGDVSARCSRVMVELELERKGFVLVTLHRAGNTDEKDKLAAFADNLAALAKVEPVVFVVHPRTRARLEEFGLSSRLGAARLIEPLSFLDMIQAVRQARVVLTDSGGLQKEAYFHRTPCVTLRSETEWEETVEAGWNRLLDPADAGFVEAVVTARDGGGTIDEYGDGHAASRIAEILAAT